MRISKEQLMMSIAELIAQRSTCSRLHVGTIITDKNIINIKSYGYNGNYKGGPNKCDSNVPGECGCIHSEVNALIKVYNKQPDDIMFITNSPCINCAKLIINAEIKTIYYKNQYRKNDGIKLLKKNNIKIIKL